MSLAPPVDAGRIARTLAEMVAIPSVNPFGTGNDAGGEAALGAYVAAWLADHGCDVTVCEVAAGRPNVIARIAGGPGRSIMLAGHLDTVGVEGYPEPFEPRVIDGRLHGRGSADMKGGLAAILEVAAALADAGRVPDGDVVIAAICDEEFEMIGSRRIGRDGPACDFGVVAEPTSLAVCPAHKGQLGLVLRTLGRAAHSSRPELGTNAIRQMMRAVDALETYADALMARDPHPLCGHPTYNPGVISGGTVASVVPASCELEIDRRTLPGERFEDVIAEIDALLGPLAAADAEFRYEVSGPTWDIAGLDVPIDSEPVSRLARAHSAVSGEPPQIEAFPAATDAPNLGFPAVVYGPGALDQAHSTDEFIDLDEVVVAAQVYVALVTGGADP